MSVLSDLDKLGLGDLGGKDLYGKEETPARNEAAEAPAAAQGETAASREEKHRAHDAQEAKALYERSYDCQVCGNKFTSKTVRTGHVHTLRTDYDLRPVYDVLDQHKYEVVSCPRCGCAALARYFGKLSVRQEKLLKEMIGQRYKPVSWDGEIYSYSQARLRFQLALANTMVLKSKASEKAFLCLKAAWLCRGQQEELRLYSPEKTAEIEEAAAKEQELLKEALEGFVYARQNETPPIAGMDDKTLDYLLAALFYGQGNDNDSMKLLVKILTDKSCGKNLRTKAENLRDMIHERRKSEEKASADA